MSEELARVLARADLVTAVDQPEWTTRTFADLARLALEQAERIAWLERDGKCQSMHKQDARIATLEGLLRELEWETCPISEQEECVWCMNRAPDHADDCRLAAALGEK